MTGDPLASCDMPLKSCKNNLQCGAGSQCSDGICASKCVSSDQDCLPNEVCKSGVCKRICSNNDQCGDNQVCIDRMCVKGCLTSQQCPGNQVCSGNQCRDPCQDNSPCGDCASCQVVSHQVQCSCPAGAAGDPFASCFSNSLKCGSTSTSISKTRNRFSRLVFFPLFSIMNIE